MKNRSRYKSEMEIARMEVHIPQMSCYDMSAFRNNERMQKNRFRLKDTYYETQYFNKLARDAIKTTYFRKGKKEPLFIFENETRRILNTPHRVDPKLHPTEMNNNEKSIDSFDFLNDITFDLRLGNTSMSLDRPERRRKLVTEKLPDKGDQIVIKKALARKYDQHIKNMLLGAPPKAGLDDVLDKFIDHIDDLIRLK